MNLDKISLKNKITTANASILLLLLVLSITSYTSLKSLTESNKWVDHTHVVIGKAQEIVGAAVDMETGLRGFLLAGKEEFLEPYHGGNESFTSLVTELKKTVSDNPVQVTRLGKIDENIQEWITKVTEPAIQLRREIGDSETMNDMARRVAKAEGKTYFDQFRAQIALFIDTEKQLLKARTKKLDSEKNPSKIRNAVDWVVHTNQVIEKALEIEISAINMETGMRGYLLAGDDAFKEPYIAGKNAFETLVNNLQIKVSDNPSQVALLNQIKQLIGEWQRNVVNHMLAQRQKIGNSKTMDDMADLVGQAKGKTYFDKFRGQIKEFIDMEKALMIKRQADAANTYSRSIMTIVMVLLLSIVVSVALSIILTNSIANPFKMIFSGLTTFSKDELMQLKDGFNEVVDKLTENSSQVAKASQSIAVSSSSLSSNASEQAAAVEETSSSVEEMYGILQNNISLAQSSYDLANKARGNVNDLTDSFSKIEDSNKEIETLVKVIKEVGEKTKVIDEIVFQTKLLSFNASVEAERAGEHGRGFAVVAQEVGNLAALSGKAAVEISSIVKDSTERGAAIAKENADRVQQGSVAMKKTVELIESVSSSSKKIVDASKEQAKGVDQINHAIQEINGATQNSASIASDSSTSSTNLNTQAVALKNMVDKLNFYLSGRSSGMEAHMPHHDNTVTVIPIDEHRNNINQSKKHNVQKLKSPAPTQKMAVGQDTVAKHDEAQDSWEDL